MPSEHTSGLPLLLRDLGAPLRRLSSNQHSAVLLIGVDGKSYAEAAESM
jgi:DNA-directed RNA polymerase specialized sigma24 family protein